MTAGQPTSVLVQTMEGTSVEHLDHEPDEAEMHAIKERYHGYGHDVVSVRGIADARLWSMIGAGARG